MLSVEESDTYSYFSVLAKLSAKVVTSFELCLYQCVTGKHKWSR